MSKTCYIVGKGPSLDTLIRADFGDGLIITINEAVTKIESLNLPNTIYSLQQDGKPQCMRRPKRATLYLSQESKQWFPDYEPRVIYDKTKMRVPNDAFSAIVAMEIAEDWGAEKIIFKAFDACTCGDISYASGISYYDPRNNIRIFNLHCEIMKLMNHGLRMFFDDKEIHNAPYTIITPTGDRSEVMRLCRKYVLNQTVLPRQWIIVDDGKKPMKDDLYRGATYVRREPQPFDPSHTLKVNMIEGLKYVNQPHVLIFEDDDWYHPEYAEYCLSHCGDAQLFGTGYTYYYHYGSRKYKKLVHTDRASWCTTGFKSDIIPQVIDACNREKGFCVDLTTWKLNVKKKAYTPSRVLQIGLKGLVGRPGQTSGHYSETHYYEPDTTHWLEDQLGDSLKDYENLASVDKPKSAPKPKPKPKYEDYGVKVHYLDDGSFMIPRRDKSIEAVLDRMAIRIPNELRWYPKDVKCKPLNILSDQFKKQVCYIVGKGPSLDMLSKDNFGSGPIIAINEAIHKVELLDLDNPIIALQIDNNLKDHCWSKKGNMLVSVNCGILYADHPNLYVFAASSLNLTQGIGVCNAICLAKNFGAKELKLLCFDAYTHKITDYAKIIGYPSSKGGTPDRFLNQAINIKKQLNDSKLPYSFITPGDLP